MELLPKATKASLSGIWGCPFQTKLLPAHYDTAGFSKSHYYMFYSARQLAKVWLRNYEFFSTTDYGNEVGSWFESPNASCIHTELSGTSITRSKAGWIAMKKNVNATCDGGIVYSTYGPYIIAIMSNVPSNFKKLEPLMHDIDAAHNEWVVQSTTKKMTKDARAIKPARLL